MALPNPKSEITFIQTSKYEVVDVPVLDLSKPDSKILIKAFEEYGIAKVINHGVQEGIKKKMELDALAFFSKSMLEKENESSYMSRKIGPNGDIGWVEYLIMRTLPSDSLQQYPQHLPYELRYTVEDYRYSLQILAIKVLEILAQGLGMQEKNVFSKFLIDEKSDTIFRINHYPPYPDIPKGHSLLGIGEHSDPQIITIIGSNKVDGFQICLRDGKWVSVTSDSNAFYVIVDDLMEVMTNGRFKSLRHRALANGSEDRLSSIYFGGPPLSTKIAPIIVVDGEQIKYSNFTWEDYKKATVKTKLTFRRLGAFEIQQNGSKF